MKNDDPLMGHRVAVRHRMAFEADSRGLAKHILDEHKARLTNPEITYLSENVERPPLGAGAWGDMDSIHYQCHAVEMSMQHDAEAAKDVLDQLRKED